MSLTGVPLTAAALLCTAAAVTATVWFWSRSGRWRLAVRIVGVLLSEALLMCGAGLIANRAGQFYPSWAALRGQTGTKAAATARANGRLDRSLHAGAVPWRPDGLPGWQLAAAPSLRVPPGYAAGPGLTFPVVLDLSRGRGPTAAAPDAVTVHAPPSARTTPEALAELCGRLAGDVRVTPRGWAIVAPLRDAGLVLRLVQADPDRIVAIALVGTGTAPQTSLPVTVHRGYPEALVWAAGQTAAPLVAPVELPGAGVS